MTAPAPDGRRITTRTERVSSGLRLGELVLVGWLTLSLMTFSRSPAQSSSTAVSAVVIAFASLAALRVEPRARFAATVAGVWLVASFWLMYDAIVSRGSLNDVLVGTLVVLSSVVPVRRRIDVVLPVA